MIPTKTCLGLNIVKRRLEMKRMTGREIVKKELKQLGSSLVCDVGGMFVLKTANRHILYQGRSIEELERQAEAAGNFQVS